MLPDLTNLEEVISQTSGILIFVAFWVLLLLALTSTQIKHPHSAIKKLLFFSIVGIVLLTTLFLAGSTLYLNAVSKSHGPIHYHADIQIYKCGSEIFLPL